MFHCPNNTLFIVGNKNISSKGEQCFALIIGLKEDIQSKLHQTRQWDGKSQCKGGKKGFDSILKTWAPDISLQRLHYVQQSLINWLRDIYIGALHIRKKTLLHITQLRWVSWDSPFLTKADHQDVETFCKHFSSLQSYERRKETSYLSDVQILKLYVYGDWKYNGYWNICRFKKKKKTFCIVHLQLSRPRTTHPTKMTF